LVACFVYQSYDFKYLAAMNFLKRIISKLPLYNKLVIWGNKIVLPGFHGLSIYEVARFFFKNIGDTNLGDRSAAVTYNFLMALPPTLLFLFSLVPYLPLQNVEQTIYDTIYLVTPDNTLRESLTTIVNEFLNKERTGILSFGVLMTLYFSSNGMMGLMRSFDRSSDIHVERNNLKRRWVAFKLTLMLIGVAILSLAVLIIQTSAINGLIQQIFQSLIAVKLLSFLIVITIIFCSISLIYTYGPSLAQRFPFVSPGSVFATLLCVLTSVGFFFMIGNFINYNKVYGPIGSIIAFMVWIWLNTFVILLGYELNVSILLGKKLGSAHGKKKID